ncbi:MAG: signal peptidase I [Acidimicrobiia bacterium]|nr:signal peptidase I [Acidimicrobiia bacterium]
MLDVIAQTTTELDAGPPAIFWVVYFAVIAVWIAGMWTAFAKAGQPGWAAIVPIYNIYIWTKIVGREPWWIILLIIPCVNFVAMVVLSVDMAKSFGKDAAYGIGLWLLPFVFWPMLGFGSSQYRGPVGPLATTT